MKTRVSLGLIVSLSTALALWAGNFWEEKPYQEWDRLEVQTIITRSPWTGTVEAGGLQTRDWGGLSRPESGGGSVTAGAEGRASAPPPPPSQEGYRAGVPGADQGEGDRAYKPGARTYFVIWSSAQTVRRALGRNQVLMGMASPEQVEQALQQPMETYQVTIIGADMSAFEQLRPDDLQGRTYLKAKKTKQELQPVEVNINRGGTAERVVSVTFSFPRQLPSGEAVIGPDEKKVEFVCDIKEPKVKIKTAFEPKRMTVNGEADL